MEWAWHRQDKTAVLECLQRGEYEAIATSRQSALDTLAHLAAELGVLEAASEMGVSREREGIPDELLLRTLAVMPFVEAAGLSGAAEALFEDAAILRQLGYTPRQIREGFNGRRGPGREEKSEGALPCHPEVLRGEVGRLTAESIGVFRQRCVQALFERGLVKGKTYAIDGSGIRDRYRVVGILNVAQDRTLWVNWRVLAGEASEKGKEGSVVREMVDEVRAWGGEEAIHLLLMDALYADGPLLAWLKYARGIEALVRLPEDRELYQELWSLVAEDPGNRATHPDLRYVAGHKQVREVTVGSMGALDAWDSFSAAAATYGEEGATLWGYTIESQDVTDPYQAEQWALVSTEEFPTGWQAYTTWRKRWRIENCGFREIKEGWHLEVAPWSYQEQRVVEGRVAFTCVAYNVAQMAKTAEGRRLTQRGIRRLRHALAQEVGPTPVIVFAGGAYGLFNIEEIMQALGRPPQESLRRHPHPAKGPAKDTGPP